MRLLRSLLVWGVILSTILAAHIAAAASPLLAWREPIYIAAGFAGISALCGLLIQPLAAARLLPGVSASHSRALHRWLGGAILLLIALHVAALWVTSPPDVIDALLFVSPTPFSVWGVGAMWAAIAAAIIGRARSVPGLGAGGRRKLHMGLATATIAGSVVHAWLIVGTMETLSKATLCLLVLVATAKALAKLRPRPR